MLLILDPRFFPYLLPLASDNKFIMAADSKRVVQPGARGRDSVRIVSIEAWNEFLVVLDLQHMPEGCATWPAYWTLSRAGPWPNGGEVDIIEGASYLFSLCISWS